MKHQGLVVFVFLFGVGALGACGGGESQHGGVVAGGGRGGGDGGAGQVAAGADGGSTIDASAPEGSIYFVVDSGSDRADAQPDVQKDTAPGDADAAPGGADAAPGDADAAPGDAAAGAGGADKPPTAIDGSGVAGDALISCTWVGDFDGDGTADCATLVQADGQTGDIVFRKGTGPATYSTEPVTSAGIVPITPAQARATLAIVDLNHDGRQDIITAKTVTIDPNFPPKYDRYVLMFSGQADGTFVARPGGEGIKTTGPSMDLSLGPGSVLAPEFWTDFDGDGFTDVLARVGVLNQINEWALLRSAGGADFQVTETPVGTGGYGFPKALIATGTGKAIVSVGFINPGKPLDCAFATQTGIFRTIGAPNGSMSTSKLAESDFATDVVAKDVDGDGLPDLVTTFQAGAPNCGTTRCRAQQVAFMSKLNYRYPPLSTFASEALDNMIDTGEFNGDGAVDDINICAPGDATVYVSNLGGGAPIKVVLPNTANALQYHVSDLNADGKSDIELTFIDGKKKFYGDGAGHFSATPP